MVVVMSRDRGGLTGVGEEWYNECKCDGQNENQLDAKIMIVAKMGDVV